MSIPSHFLKISELYRYKKMNGFRLAPGEEAAEKN